MSDTIYKFIPVNLNDIFSKAQMEDIEKLHFDGVSIDMESGESIAFADAGENFESVACPFCHTDMTDWWGDAMDAAYSETNGFYELSVTTPCCRQKTSLANLDYNPPQGFYKTMVSCSPHGDSLINSNAIQQTLQKITACDWRVIIARI